MTPNKPRRRASGDEREARLAFLGRALSSGMNPTTAVRLAMSAFGIRRRMAQLYVKLVREEGDPLASASPEVMRLLRTTLQVLRMSGPTAQTDPALSAPNCAAAMESSPQGCSLQEPAMKAAFGGAIR